MNWTTQQAEAALRRAGVANPLAAACGESGVKVQVKRGPNKWEHLYAQKLDAEKAAGAILWYQFEGMRFRLADDAYYKPDFVALTREGDLIAYEVKGMWREAARVRIKVAADRFPIRFVAVRKRLVREGGGWEEEWFSAEYDRLTRKAA